MARIAVVTGASAGIGVALAIRLVKAGYEPLLLARRADKLAEAAARVKAAGGTPHVGTLDVTAPGAARQALALAAKIGDPEVLVNNAGRGVYGAFAELPLDEQMAEIDLNVRALVEFCGVFLPGMIERRRGYVLNVASTAAFQSNPWQCVYSATKAFVVNFTEGLAIELEGTGASATCLCPGPTESEFFDVAGYEKKGMKIPKGVVMPAEKVADIGVRAMLAHKGLVIAGVQNKAGALASKLAPRALTTRVVGMIFAGGRRRKR